MLYSTLNARLNLGSECFVVDISSRPSQGLDADLEDTSGEC